MLGLARGGLANGMIAGLMFGALAAPLAFLIAHSVGLLMMPESFFTTEAAVGAKIGIRRNCLQVLVA